MKKIQQGITLISLLIGLLISMIAVAGMLVIFRNAVQTTAHSAAAAVSDGERISSLHRMHMLIQNAGFGLDNPEVDIHLAEPDMITWNKTSHTLHNSYSGDSVIWSSDTDLDGVVTCEGIVPTDEGGIRWIYADCNDAGDWSNVQDWAGSNLIGPSAPGIPPVSLTVSIDRHATCSSVGSGNTASDVFQGVPATFSIVLTTGSTVSSTTCLYNFKPDNP